MEVKDKPIYGDCALFKTVKGLDKSAIPFKSENQLGPGC